MKIRPVKVTQEILALRFKPDDFYHIDRANGNLWMDTEMLVEASKLAHQLFRNGPSKAGSILVCKMADGIREYNRLVNEFVVNSLPDDWKWGREILYKYFEKEGDK